MKSLLEVLDIVRKAGGTVSIEAGTVRLRVPAGSIGPAERFVLTANRQILLGLFAPVTSSTSTHTTSWDGELAWFETLPVEMQQQYLDWALVEWKQLVDGDREPPRTPPIPIHMKSDTSWHEPDEGRYTIPAGHPGWLVASVEDQVEDLELRQTIEDTLTRKAQAGTPAVAVFLGGKPRVVELRLVRIGNRCPP